MDQKKPPDLGSMSSMPWLGRRGGLQPQDPAVGRSRGLLLSPEGPNIGRARGFPTLGDTPQGRGVTLPITEPVVGRARGLLFPAAEPKVGVAGGAIMPSLETQHRPMAPHETQTQHQTVETSASTTKEVRSKKYVSADTAQFACFNFLNILLYIKSC